MTDQFAPLRACLRESEDCLGRWLYEAMRIPFGFKSRWDRPARDLRAKYDEAAWDFAAAVDAGLWQPIETAPKDGTRILAWTVHANAAYSKDPVGEGWACVSLIEWTDHNGGGWTWHGLCGVHTHWRPLPGAPA